MDTVKIDAKQVKMVAHRGCSALERENTYPAFVAAGNRSYYGVETDVHVGADGEFIIIHDETTQRVSMGASCINVEESDYETIRQVVLPDLDGSTHRQDIRIPRLIDYVKICKKYEKVCVLELKNAFIQEDIERMVEEIRALDYLEHMIFISFDLNNCCVLRKLLPDSTIQWLLGNVEITQEHLQIMREHRLDVDICFPALNEQVVQTFHDNGIAVNCWTCDDPQTAAKLVEMGVDFITSNVLEGA